MTSKNETLQRGGVDHGFKKIEMISLYHRKPVSCLDPAYGTCYAIWTKSEGMCGIRRLFPTQVHFDMPGFFQTAKRLSDNSPNNNKTLVVCNNLGGQALNPNRKYSKG